MPEIALPTKAQVDLIKTDTSAIITKINTNLDTTVSSRATQATVNTINTNVGSNADAASATGSVHAKLKDLKTFVSSSSGDIKYRPLNVYGATADVNNFVTIVNITGSGYIDLINIGTANQTSFKIIIDGVVKYWTKLSSSRLVFLTPNRVLNYGSGDGYTWVDIWGGQGGMRISTSYYSGGYTYSYLKFPTWVATEQAAHHGVVALSQPIYFNSSFVVQGQAYYRPASGCDSAVTYNSTAYVEGGLV